MNFGYKRSYQGPIEAVLLDWAGTTMDYGCMAPAHVFVEVFKRKGVPITIAEARAPMGAHKRVHIQRISELESVRARWQQHYGRPPNDDDVSAMFAEFVPLQVACLSEYSTLIPGTLEVIGELRRRGMKIGSTSGYLPEMMRVNQEDAKRQGYEPDATVCAGDVPAGRPYPHMCLLNVIKLGVSTVQACVKIDDTVPGVEEGLNAGMWTIGLAISGNEVGMPLKDWQALPAAEQQAKRQRAYGRMQQCGAHYTVDSIADVMPCIDDIQARIRRGEAP
ncbi:MAG: phosphonoacetaldehyde hydrolase [Rhodoferax sp.]|uniref:phosphonoacetaldehyde hydrolase n=1 Tax=Rhodoferax sp. TaxID=50421 RepID=UPI00260F17D6|nr:phosphonoacetaldehyde hydrolase [Rhodoferax sp.]MDD5333191.1 phosphonoacetaldehyde hydrolase [Rhodoferax sp.]